jgi:hypothetical protein
MGFAFVPATLTINPGDSVTWTNQDGALHTSTSDTAVWHSGVIDTGGSFTFTFPEPGAFPYHCNFHPSMRGTILVNGGTPTPTPTPSPTFTPTPTPTFTPTPTPTFTPTPTSTPTPTPTLTPTPRPTSTPTPTLTPTPRPTSTPTPTLTPTPRPTPTSTPTPTIVEVTPGAGAIAASTHDGNVPGNTVDNRLDTRWSGNGDGAWLKLDLGSMVKVTHVRIAWYLGNTRFSRFDLQYSNDDATWRNLRTNLYSNGRTTEEQTFDVPDTRARWIRYVGHGNSSPTKGTWNSVTEVSVFASMCTACPAPTLSAAAATER